jgi:uroporphyrinogen-III decarboxylase
MGFARTMRFVYMEEKEKLSALFEAIERYNDKFYEAMAQSPLEIFNLGENIDVRLASPVLFEKYCLPVYQKRCDFLYKHGKYVHMHVDGYAKPLLPLLANCGLDGIEALTTVPVGDMTLVDIKKELGDNLVILDGIPFIMFLPDYPLAQLESFVREIISMFPRLVLGISDELPPPADSERVGKVSKWIEKFSPQK